MSSLEANKELYMYLTILDCVVSTILFWHVMSGEKRPIYYVSKTMVDAETRYSQVEQTVLPLRIVVKKLSILSSSSSNDFDIPVIVGYIAQTRSIRMNDKVGDWVKQVWHTLQASTVS